MNYQSKEFFESFRKTQGALSTCESIAIYNIALMAKEGVYLELGSHKGKSGMSASAGLKKGIFYLVDPIFEDVTLVKEVCDLVKSVSSSNISLEYFADYSTNIIDLFNNLSFVFLDSGDHCNGLPMQEVKMLEDRIIEGGILVFHDYNSQFFEVTEAHKYLIETGKYENIPIDWPQIIEYVKANNLEAGNQTWHHTEMEYPCFVGALRKNA